MTPRIKNFVIFLIIAISIIIVYIFFIKKGPEEAPLVSVLSTTTTTADLSPNSSLLTQDFLSILLNVKNIKLNDAIFNDPAFISLSDSSILLTPDGTEGRLNPFAPIGSDPQVSAPLNTSVPPAATLSSENPSILPDDSGSAEAQ